MKLDRELQKKILTELRACYPDILEFEKADLARASDFHANAFYLEDHGLLENHGAHRHIMGAEPQMFAASITAKGLDFLEDDGGLGAILGKITVTFDDDAIRALLGSGIDHSSLPADQKETFRTKVRGLTRKAMETVVVELVKKGMENVSTLVRLIG